MRYYIGMRDSKGKCRVYRLQHPCCSLLPLRLTVRNHSPCGFEWGYGGSGPAQLALALLCDALGDPEAALKLYQRFKFSVIGRLEQHGWIMSEEDVVGWVMTQLAPAAWPPDGEPIELGRVPS